MLPNMLLLTHLFDEHMHLHTATNAHAFAHHNHAPRRCIWHSQQTVCTHKNASSHGEFENLVEALSKSCAVILCFNPLCASCHNSFATEKAFTLHRQRSPLCLAIVHCDRTMTPQSWERKCVDATVADTVVSCTKRPKALHCKFVNDVLHYLSAAALSVAKRQCIMR